MIARQLDPSSVVESGGGSDRVSTRLMDLFRETGNREAYDLLFGLNETRLRRWIGNRIRHLPLPIDSGDILQETFFNIYRYPYRFRSDKDSSFRVWVGAIVSNIIRRHLRRHCGRPHSVGPLPESEAPEQVDTRSEPIRFAMEEEARESLGSVYLLLLAFYLDCYRSLAPRDRRVLHLVEVEGLRYREVGRILGTRADNVKMLVFRARQRLFRLLGERLEGGE